MLRIRDYMGFPGVKNLPASAGDIRLRFSPWVGKIPWRGAWLPTPGFFPGESPWTEESAAESDTTEVTPHTQGYFYGLPWGIRRRLYDRMEKARVWNHETRFCELIARWPQLL